jgi:hypothetical protein
MARKRKHTDKVTASWDIKPKIYQKIEVYKALHKLDSIEVTANILLEKATANIKLPE